MSAAIRIVAIAGCAGLLAWPCYAGGYPLAASAAVVAGGLWIFAGRRWPAVGYLGLALTAVSVAAGEILGLAPVPLLFGLALSLAAWDLEDFSRRLARGALQDDRAALERRHLTKLGLVLALGLSLSLTALATRGVRLNFEVSVGLALLAAWGVMYLVVRLRKHTSADSGERE